MPKWISFELAEDKYGYSEDMLWLWADMKRFPISYSEWQPIVNDDSMAEFLRRHRSPPSEDYVSALEERCVRDRKVFEMYVQMLGSRDRELARLRIKIARIENSTKHESLIQHIRAKLRRWM